MIDNEDQKSPATAGLFFHFNVAFIYNTPDKMKWDLFFHDETDPAIGLQESSFNFFQGLLFCFKT